MLTGLWRNGRVQRFLGGVVCERVAEERFAGILEHWRGHGYGMCQIREKTTGRPVGLCGLDHLEDEVQVAYKLSPEFWAKGYATESATEVVRVGFEVLGLGRIVGVAQEANHGSRRVLEKIGMRHELGMIIWGSPQCLYSINKPEWKSPGTPNPRP